MDQESFDEWMGRVDSACMERHSVSVRDLPDMAWRDYANDGLDPEQALDAAEEDGLLS